MAGFNDSEITITYLSDAYQKSNREELDRQ